MDNEPAVGSAAGGGIVKNKAGRPRNDQQSNAQMIAEKREAAYQQATLRRAGLRGGGGRELIRKRTLEAEPQTKRPVGRPRKRPKDQESESEIIEIIDSSEEDGDHDDQPQQQQQTHIPQQMNIPKPDLTESAFPNNNNNNHSLSFQSRIPTSVYSNQKFYRLRLDAIIYDLQNPRISSGMPESLSTTIFRLALLRKYCRIRREILMAIKFNSVADDDNQLSDEAQKALTVISGNNKSSHHRRLLPLPDRRDLMVIMREAIRARIDQHMTKYVQTVFDIFDHLSADSKLKNPKDDPSLSPVTSIPDPDRILHEARHCLDQRAIGAEDVDFLSSSSSSSLPQIPEDHCQQDSPKDTRIDVYYRHFQSMETPESRAALLARLRAHLIAADPALDLDRLPPFKLQRLEHHAVRSHYRAVAKFLVT